MNPRHHHVPPDLFGALAAGRGGPDAIRELIAAQYSKHVILLWGVLTAAQNASAKQERLVRAGYNLLASVRSHDPATAEETIRYPSVGAWALHTVRASRSDPPAQGAELGGLNRVAAAAAIRARLYAEIEVPASEGRVVLPSLGVAIVDGDTAVVRSYAHGAEVASAGRRVEVPPDPHRDAPHWLGLRCAQAGSLSVLVDDLDPFRMPALSHLAPRLTAIEAAKWNVAIQEAWSVLATHHRHAAAEIASVVTVFVPLTTPFRGQVSSTSAETFGAIALSEPPDCYIGAATLVHEMQHLKLSALLDIVTLTMPDDGCFYYAPWRRDPRPIGGLLQGAYAHLGVSRFWRRQRQLLHGAEEIRAHIEFARWRAATTQAVQTLQASRRLTPAGLEFIQGMALTLSGWQRESVPADAEALARREAELHLARWQFDNGPLQLGDRV